MVLLLQVQAYLQVLNLMSSAEYKKVNHQVRTGSLFDAQQAHWERSAIPADPLPRFQSALRGVVKALDRCDEQSAQGLAAKHASRLECFPVVSGQQFAATHKVPTLVGFSPFVDVPMSALLNFGVVAEAVVCALLEQLCSENSAMAGCRAAACVLRASVWTVVKPLAWMSDLDQLA